MYGRLHQRKLKEDDYIMSCQKARRELDYYIDDEAKRVNIDSAKKRAVLQHMDYEGFRQMVLGANIFSTKSTQLQKFTKGQNSQVMINKIFLEGKPQALRTEVKNLPEDNLLRQVEGKSQMECNSFREFKKKFSQNFPKNGQLNIEQGEILYTLIKTQSKQRIEKIFNMECEASILTKIIDLFNFIENYLRENDDEGKVVKEIVFQIKFMQTVLRLKTMRDFSLSILSKKERTKIIDFLQKGKQVMMVGRNFQKKQEQKQIANENHAKISEQTGQKEKQQQGDVNLEKPMSQDEKFIDQLVQILLKK